MTSATACSKTLPGLARCRRVVTVGTGRSPEMRIWIQAQGCASARQGLGLHTMTVVTSKARCLVTLVPGRVAGLTAKGLVETVQFELRVFVVDKAQRGAHKTRFLMTTGAGMIHLPLMRILVTVFAVLTQSDKSDLGR